MKKKRGPYTRKEETRHRKAPMGTKAFDDRPPIKPRPCARCDDMFKPSETNRNQQFCIGCLQMHPVRIIL